MNKVTYTVPNISCMHCIHTIKNEIGDVPGVKTVAADLNTKLVTVEYDTPATPEQLEATFEEINYPVKK